MRDKQVRKAAVEASAAAAARREEAALAAHYERLRLQATAAEAARAASGEAASTSAPATAPPSSAAAPWMGSAPFAIAATAQARMPAMAPVVAPLLVPVAAPAALSAEASAAARRRRGNKYIIDGSWLDGAATQVPTAEQQPSQPQQPQHVQQLARRQAQEPAGAAHQPPWQVHADAGSLHALPAWEQSAADQHLGLGVARQQPQLPLGASQHATGAPPVAGRSAEMEALLRGLQDEQVGGHACEGWAKAGA